MNIDIRAQVQCVDGAAGRCTRVIVIPAKLRVTGLVVQANQDPYSERLVPLDQVSRAEVDGISLDCTLRELSLMDEFVHEVHIQVDVPDYHDLIAHTYLGSPIPAEPMTEVMAEERISPDEVALDSDTRVEATDGWVGQLHELNVEPRSGSITSLVMRTGHVWEQKSVTIPAAQIDRMESKAVSLKLDRQSVEGPPGVPAGK